MSGSSPMLPDFINVWASNRAKFCINPIFCSVVKSLGLMWNQ